VIGHLTDYDLVSFLRRCQKVRKRLSCLNIVVKCHFLKYTLQCLRPNGVICLKDNTYLGEKRKNGSMERFFVDLEDSSMTRSTEYFEAIFEIAGLKLLLKEQQEEFPEELYPVMMYALC
jgi:protein N-terminal methyltransferase